MNFKNLNESFTSKYSISKHILKEEKDLNKSILESKKRFSENIDRTSLLERDWEFTIPGNFRNDIFEAGEEEDYEGVRNALINLCNYVIDHINESDFEPEEQEDIIKEFEDFIEEIKYVDIEDEDEANYYLNDLYDLLDATDIFLGLREGLNEEVPGGRYWEPGWEDANDYADAIISDYYDYGEFLDWCERQYGPGFNPMDLSDEEYYELEDAFKADNNLKNESLKSLIEAIHPNIDRVQGAYEEAVNQGLKKQAEKILADTLIKVKKGKCIETSANSNTANAYYRLYRLLLDYYTNDKKDESLKDESLNEEEKPFLTKSDYDSAKAVLKTSTKEKELKAAQKTIKRYKEQQKNRGLNEEKKYVERPDRKVFTVHIGQNYPFYAWVVDNSFVDKNGEGKILQKFTDRKELDRFANELCKKGYKNYQDYPTRDYNESLKEDIDYGSPIETTADYVNERDALDYQLIEPLINALDELENNSNRSNLKCSFTWNFGRRLSDDKMTAGIDVYFDPKYDFDDEDREEYWTKPDEEILDKISNAIIDCGFEFDSSLGYDSLPWKNHLFGKGYHTQIVEIEDTIDESVEEYESLNEGIEVDDFPVEGGIWSFSNLKARNNRFKNEASKYPYWVIKTSKWYDPEGLNLENNDYQIAFAGDYDECTGWIANLILKAKKDPDTYVIEEVSEDSVKIYYPHAIAKEMYTVKKNESLNEASYGGAFDIEDDMFFTKEDIVEFADEIAVSLSGLTNEEFYVSDVYMDSPKKIHVELTNGDIWITGDAIIDFRKIKYPSDIKKYKDVILKQLKDSLDEYDYFNESLNESASMIEPIAPTIKDYKKLSSMSDMYDLRDSYVKSSMEWYEKTYPQRAKDAGNRMAREIHLLHTENQKIRDIEKSLTEDNESLKKSLQERALYNRMNLDRQAYLTRDIYNALNDIMHKYRASAESWEDISPDEMEQGWNYFKIHAYDGVKPDIPLNDDGAKMFDLLTEDTIKQNGKWVNKGKEGTHGTFKTKKEADAQRKAMFANKQPGSNWGK